MSIEKPLYRLLRELSDYISNRNECASIVGYTLAQSILHFSTTSGDPQEIKFEQVKDLYRRIQENIDDCRRSGSEDSCKNPGFNILSSLEARLSPELKYEVLQSYFTAEAEPEGKKRENRTPLRPALVQSLTRRTHGYEERLRRIGLNLIDSARPSKPKMGAREILTQDYDTIAGLFK